MSPPTTQLAPQLQRAQAPQVAPRVGDGVDAENEDAVALRRAHRQTLQRRQATELG